MSRMFPTTASIDPAVLFRAMGYGGTGRSGAVTIAATSSSTAPIYATTFVVNAGVAFRTAGHPIYATVSLTVNVTGIIEPSAPATIDASGATPGGAVAQGSYAMGAVAAGGAGNVAAGSPGGAIASSAIAGTVADHGGDGGAGVNAGGDGGGTTATTANSGALNPALLINFLTGINMFGGAGSGFVRFNGGGGGGGGGGDGVAGAGGGGGGGGGIIGLFAAAIVNNGVIRAPGGNGGAGAVTGLATGGGGPGGGGGIVSIAASYSGSGSYSVAAGTPGSGGSGGASGAAGTAGVRLHALINTTAGFELVTP